MVPPSTELLPSAAPSSVHHFVATPLPLFEPAAIEALFQASRGLPRQVNRIAHFALTAAALDQLHTVNIRHLEHGCAEIMP